METQTRARLICKQRIAVVILNWNGKALLEKYLPSVLQHSAHLADIIVADNASTDDSVNFLKSKYPEIALIYNKDNGGYTKGYNDALNAIDAEFYVLLNSDIDVSAGWLEAMLEQMDKFPHLAACQPRMRWDTQRESFEYAGAAGGFIDALGYPFCRGRIFDTLEKDEGQYEDAVEVFWATGACMFIRSKCFHEAGGLDEEFFAHMEEIDLCWRLRNMGYGIAYCPKAVVYHLGGGTLAKNNPRKTYLNFRNNLLMMHKNLTKLHFYSILLPRLILDGVAGLKFALDGGFADCVAVIKAHFYFYGKIFRKPQRSYPLKEPAPGLIFPGSIVMCYFLRKQKKFSDLNWSINKLS